MHASFPGSTSQSLIRQIAISLAAFTTLTGVALLVALILGATVAFNILVFALFTVLWLAFGAAATTSANTLDDFWASIRSRNVLLQLGIWLLLLPIMIGLWIWERPWSSPIRIVLVAALALWNILVFFPRGTGQ
jgi:hypothetical protein